MELSFDYKPVSGDLSLDITPDDYNFWNNNVTLANLDATNGLTYSDYKAALSKDDWNTVDITADFDLGTITFVVNGAEAVTKPFTTHTGGVTYQSNEVVSPTSYKMVRFVHGTSNSAEAKLTNVTLKTLERAEELPNKTLTVASNNDELGTAYIDTAETLTKSVTQSQNVTATASAKAGARFIKWTSGANDIGTATTITRRMYADETITANFAKLYNINVADLESKGTITIDGSKVNAIEGEEVKITVAAADSYLYDANSLEVYYEDNGKQTVTLNPSDTSEEGTFTFAMPAHDVTITASFSENSAKPATVKVEYKTDGETTIDTISYTGESLFEGSNFTLPDKYKRLTKNTSDDKFKVYNYVSGDLTKEELAAGENVFTLTVTTDDVEYYYYEDYKYKDTVDWTSAIPERYKTSIGEGATATDKCAIVSAVGNGNNGTTASNASVVGSATNPLVVEFDMALTPANGHDTSVNTSTFIVGATKDATGYLIKLSQVDKNNKVAENLKWTLNGEEISLTPSAFYHYKLERTAENLKVTITPNGDGAAITKTFVTANANEGEIEDGNMSLTSKVNGMYYGTGKYYAGMKITNVKIYDGE